jgi:hypothetical protein
MECIDKVGDDVIPTFIRLWRSGNATFEQLAIYLQFFIMEITELTFINKKHSKHT